MISSVPDRPLGSVWSVLGIEDGLAVILAGPFAASRGTPEYLVAPLYSGSEPGFVWTSEDVRLKPAETGLKKRVYAAIWNARPILDADLLFPAGQLTEEATVAVRDAYWASLNERDLGKSERLGRPIRSAADPAAEFQTRELKRWQRVSGRALASPPGISASATFVFGDHWALTLEEMAALQDNIAVSEAYVGSIKLESIGPNRASFATSLAVHRGVPRLGEQPSLFPADPAPPATRMTHGNVFTVRLQLSSGEHEQLSLVASNSELAAAA